MCSSCSELLKTKKVSVDPYTTFISRGFYHLSSALLDGFQSKQILIWVDTDK
jgi:hypothetical protein